MSKKSFQQYVVLCSSLISNGTVFRGFLKTVGIATTGDSNALTNIVDKFTCNYNYLDSINYDEDTQTITMDNTSVDKLREEIRKYYYNSIGLKEIKSNGTVNSIIDSSDFRECFEYEEDYASVFGFKNYKYCLKTRSGFYYFFNDLPDYIYVSNDSNNDRFLPSYNNSDEVAWRFRTLRSDGSFGYFQPVKEDTVIRYDYTLKVNVSDMDMMTYYEASMNGEYDIIHYRTYGGSFDPFTPITNMDPAVSADPVAVQFAAFLPEGIVSELNCSSDENRIKEIYNTILTTIPDEALCVPFANTVELAAWNSDKINSYKFCPDSQYVEVSGIDLK